MQESCGLNLCLLALGANFLLAVGVEAEDVAEVGGVSGAGAFTDITDD